MLIKNPKPTGRKLLKEGAAILLVIETGLFFGSYGIWYKLNTDRGTCVLCKSYQSDFDE